MGNLLEYFQHHNGNSANALEKGAIDAFEELSQVASWQPESPYWGRFIPIIVVGLIHRLVKNGSGLTKLKLIADSLVSDVTIDADMYSEIQCGGLLSRLGCNVTFIAEARETRTPDLIIAGDSGETIDFEVARAAQKQGHRELADLLTVLNAAIGLDDNRNYAVFLDGNNNRSYIDKIIEAIISLETGKRVECANHWAVSAGIIDERDVYAGAGDQSGIQPAWWNSSPSYFTVATRVGGGSSPVTIVKSQIPPLEYVNPVRRKAERAQRSGDFPYVIGLDCSELPRADNLLQAQLSTWFPLWSHVSGVLLFRPQMSVHHYKWKAAFLPNAHAANPLTSAMLRKLSSTFEDVSVDEAI